MTREIFEVCATLFDSILAIWFVTKFCKLQNKRMYQIAAVILLFCVTVFGEHYLASFSTLSAVPLPQITESRSGRSLPPACFGFLLLP